MKTRKEKLDAYIAKHPLLQKYIKSGVNLDIGIRWEKGVEHHLKSQELMEHLVEIDFAFCDDHHCFKTGGDGDNGEALMYLMDIYFDFKDKQPKGA